MVETIKVNIHRMKFLTHSYYLIRSCHPSCQLEIIRRQSKQFIIIYLFYPMLAIHGLRLLDNKLMFT